MPPGATRGSCRDAEKLLAEGQKSGLEGIESKKKYATYRSGTCDWIKVKCAQWREENKDRGDLFNPRSRRLQSLPWSSRHHINHVVLALGVDSAFCASFFSSRRRHTICLSDWSSDVCSSDLLSRSTSSTSDRASPATSDTTCGTSAAAGFSPLSAYGSSRPTSFAAF